MAEWNSCTGDEGRSDCPWFRVFGYCQGKNCLKVHAHSGLCSISKGSNPPISILPNVVIHLSASNGPNLTLRNVE